MRSRVVTALSLVSLLSACVATVTPVNPVVGSKAPSPRPSHLAPPASVRPAPAAAALALLLRPAGAVDALKGTIAIDARYALGRGGAKLIGQDGASIVANDGGTIVSNDGATFGRSALAFAGIVANDGATLLGQDGSSIVAGGGGNVIAGGAGNVIAGGAGNFIGKRKYDLLAEGPRQGIDFDTVLPAGGLEISVYSLVTGLPLVIGSDADGHDVLSIYTNASGHYELYLPATPDAFNVRVVARPPDSADARLDYQVMVAPKAAEAIAIDEDTALVTRFIREAFATRMEEVFVHRETSGGAADADVNAAVPPQLQQQAHEVQDTLNQAAAAARASELSPAQRRLVSSRVSDAMLAYIDLKRMIALAGPGGEIGQRDLAADFAVFMKELRLKSGERLRADPQYFDKGIYPEFLAKVHAVSPDFKVERASDAGELIRLMLKLPDLHKEAFESVFVDVGMGPGNAVRLNALFESLLANIAVLLGGNDEALATAVKTIAEAASEARTSPPVADQ